MLAILSKQPAEPHHRQDIQRFEDPRRVEDTEETLGIRDQLWVLGDLVEPCKITSHPHGHGVLPKASLRSVMSAAGGLHRNTPHRSPSTTGVSGPIIPRTKRYAEPPRWRSGS